MDGVRSVGTAGLQRCSFKRRPHHELVSFRGIKGKDERGPCADTWGKVFQGEGMVSAKAPGENGWRAREPLRRGGKWRVLAAYRSVLPKPSEPVDRLGSC